MVRGDTGGLETPLPISKYGFNPWSRKLPHAAGHPSEPQLLSQGSRDHVPQPLKPLALESVPTTREATIMSSTFCETRE